jgi:hypothetical protein
MHCLHRSRGTVAASSCLFGSKGARHRATLPCAWTMRVILLKIASEHKVINSSTGRNSAPSTFVIWNHAYLVSKTEQPSGIPIPPCNIDRGSGLCAPCITSHSAVSIPQGSRRANRRPYVTPLTTGLIPSGNTDNMAQSQPTQLAIVLSAFFLPILTYLYFTRVQSKKSNAGPLPPPTEITALYIHPIKSCHGIKVQSAKLLPTGFDLGSSMFQSSIRSDG